MTKLSLSRRRFLHVSAGVAIGATFVPRTAWGANERVAIGCIGIGGRGASDVASVTEAGGQIVALCDVDDNRRKRGQDATETFPQAKLYRDFRVMLQQEDKRLDAVTVATPDHVHCYASVTAMRMGKHVYCEKPMSHSIAEARLMAETANERKVVTQMGNQAQAGEAIRRAIEVIRAGLIGKVREVHAWTNRPTWPQGMAERPEPETIPQGLSWDLWLGPAPERPYNSAYLPFKWRGWWDFGTGALGDMGCHIINMPFWALELKHPTTIEAQAEGNTRESGPKSSIITYTFPAGPYSHELQYRWYDGGRMPADEVFAGANLTAKEVAKKFDLVMIGEKGKFFFERHSLDWLVTPAALLEKFTPPPVSLPRSRSHAGEWLDACKGGPPTQSNFGYASLLTETVLLGNLALRVGEKIHWDAAGMKVVGMPQADQYIRREYRKGWQL
jgi:predicted dehydrogenase